MKFDTIPVNPHASENARILLKRLVDASDERILTGQHTQTREMTEYEFIRRLTGHAPDVVGFELLSYSPNINYDDADEACLKEVEENKGTLDNAYSLGKEGKAILTFTFHWFSPLGGRDKSFFTENTDFDPRRILEEETPERKAFFSDLDHIAEQLERFRDEDIPILWRPFHESEGTWFWWSRYGGETAKELYKLMYHHFTEVWKLDNLIWVWSTPTSEAYPGDEYVDVIGRDLYPEDKSPTDYRREYEELARNTTTRKVPAITEVGRVPDIDMVTNNKVPWAYYMTWSGDFALTEKCTTFEELKRMYQTGKEA